MSLLNECKKRLNTPCHRCGDDTPAHQITIRGKNHAWIMYRCRECGFWFKEEIDLKEKVNEIGA